MKNLLVAIALFILTLKANPQNYPFQNVKLDDKTRLENLISLLTFEEKINCL